MGELFAGPYFALDHRPMWRELAERLQDGPSVTRMKRLAREHSIVIVAPIYELAGNKRFNTAAIIDADGSLLGSYRKTHIPNGENEVASFHEGFYYQRGDGRGWRDPARVCSTNRHYPVFATAVGRVGVSICYDRHFPGVIHSLGQGTAQIVMAPAVSFGEKSHRMWDLEFATDAARYNLFIAGSNRLGAEPPWNVSFYGHSHIVGPNGRLDNVSEHDELVMADLDLEGLEVGDGSGWDLLGDRRDDIYG